MSQISSFRKPNDKSRRVRLSPPKGFSTSVNRKLHKTEICDMYDHQGCLLEAAERKILRQSDLIIELSEQLNGYRKAIRKAQPKSLKECLDALVKEEKKLAKSGGVPS